MHEYSLTAVDPPGVHYLRELKTEECRWSVKQPLVCPRGLRVRPQFVGDVL